MALTTREFILYLQHRWTVGVGVELIPEIIAAIKGSGNLSEILKRMQRENVRISGLDDLRGLAFHGLDLTEVDLSYCDLSYGSLCDCNLRKSTFQCSHLVCTNFRGSTFPDSDFLQVNAEGANFEDADLSGAVMMSGNYRRAIFRNASLRSAVLNRSDFTGVNFSNANLLHLECNNTILDEVVFSKKTKIANASKRYPAPNAYLNSKEFPIKTSAPNKELLLKWEDFSTKSATRLVEDRKVRASEIRDIQKRFRALATGLKMDQVHPGGNLSRKEIDFLDLLSIRRKFDLDENECSAYVASAMKGSSPRTDLIDLLESRLDSALIRLGFADSMAVARQKISESTVSVNQITALSSAYKTSPGDTITVEGVTKLIRDKNGDFLQTLGWSKAAAQPSKARGKQRLKSDPIQPDQRKGTPAPKEIKPRGHS